MYCSYVSETRIVCSVENVSICFMYLHHWLLLAVSYCTYVALVLWFIGDYALKNIAVVIV